MKELKESQTDQEKAEVKEILEAMALWIADIEAKEEAIKRGEFI